MTHSKIVSIAKSMGISNASKLKSADLIRTIQTKEAILPALVQEKLNVTSISAAGEKIA